MTEDVTPHLGFPYQPGIAPTGDEGLAEPASEPVEEEEETAPPTKPAPRRKTKSTESK